MFSIAPKIFRMSNSCLFLRHFAKKVTRKSKRQGFGLGQITGAAQRDAKYRYINRPSKKIVTHLPPLNRPIKNLPRVKYAEPSSYLNEVESEVTQLDNGLRVVTEPHFGLHCTVGVICDSGSRYEVAYPSGICHFLEKLAFTSTKRFPSTGEVRSHIAKNAGLWDVLSTRDVYLCHASTDRRSVEPVMQTLSQIMLHPLISEADVDHARERIAYELQSLYMRPEQEAFMQDMIHAAAFNGNTLGLPKLCPPKNLKRINRAILLKYLKQHYTPERMVVIGVGIEHEKLLEMAEKHFTDSESICNELEADAVDDDDINVDTSTAQYTGGCVSQFCKIPSYIGEGIPELAHIAIGLESCSHQDPNFLTTCLLQVMMGGGNAFSAGGPGRGIYSRLHLNVLHRYSWMFSTIATNHAYADTGIFVIHASAPYKHLREMVDIVIQQLENMTVPPEPQELQRYKTQFQSLVLMSMESRPVVLENIARQVLATGRRKSPLQFIEEIQNITAEDVVRVAHGLLNSPAAMAARGKVADLPNIEAVQNYLLHARQYCYCPME